MHEKLAVDRDGTQTDASSIQEGSKREHRREESLATSSPRVGEQISTGVTMKVSPSELGNKCTELLESMPRAPATKDSLIMIP
jgi:hypothetical protein